MIESNLYTSVAVMCSLSFYFFPQIYCYLLSGAAELWLGGAIASCVIVLYCIPSVYLQCFDTVGWAAGRASGL